MPRRRRSAAARLLTLEAKAEAEEQEARAVSAATSTPPSVLVRAIVTGHDAIAAVQSVKNNSTYRSIPPSLSL